MKLIIFFLLWTAIILDAQTSDSGSIFIYKQNYQVPSSHSSSVIEWKTYADNANLNPYDWFGEANTWKQVSSNFGIEEELYDWKYENYLKDYTVEKGGTRFWPVTMIPRNYWWLGGKGKPISCVRFDKNTWFQTTDTSWIYNVFGIHGFLGGNRSETVGFAARPGRDSFEIDIATYRKGEGNEFYKELKSFDLREVYGVYMEFRKTEKGIIQPVIVGYGYTGILLWAIKAEPVSYRWKVSKETWLRMNGEKSRQRATIYGYKVR